MQWLPLLALPPFVPLSSPVTPVGSATGSLVDYLLGFGPLGLGVLAFGWALYRGVVVPSSAVRDAVKAARGDLLSERDRLVTEKQKAEEQRDAALKVAQEQLVPLLTSFVATSQSLIPLLQELVRRREV